MKIKKSTPTILLVVILVSLLSLVLIRDQFEAPKTAGEKVLMRTDKETTLQAIVSDLKYYGFIKSENALKFALRFAKDETSGDGNSIRIGNNTIDRQAVYLVSPDMNAWQLAKVLLNKGRSEDCSHGCPPGRFLPALLPGGELKPSEYGWVEDFDDCVKAKGQLSSEQYSQRTGEPRKCTTPDGKTFTEGSNVIECPSDLCPEE
ncbi:MAG: hypothetical protein ABH867_04470 [Patescibacteria group bacterium]